MYGRGHLLIRGSESALHVYQIVSGDYGDPIFAVYDDQGNQWHQAAVEVNQRAGGQVTL